MLYNYVSFSIEAKKDNLAVDQMIDRLKEFVPNLVIDGPFYYQGDAINYPYQKAYILTHPLDDSMKLYLHNSDGAHPNSDGTPKSEGYGVGNIRVSLYDGTSMLSLGNVLAGESYSRESAAFSGSILYVTIAGGEDYLLWSISSSAPLASPPLSIIYAPLYNASKQVYGLMYPGLNGYQAKSSYMGYSLTYKDSLLTAGKMCPAKGDFGLQINYENRYAYPEFDITQTADREHCKTVLTKNTPLIIETIYGTGYPEIDKYRRLISTDLTSRVGILLIPDSTKSEYPVGSIFILDGAWYYIAMRYNVATNYDQSQYYVFEF